TRFNLIPIAVLFLVLPVVFRFLAPTEANTVAADPDRLRAEDAHKPAVEKAEGTLAGKLDNAWILNLLLVSFGAAAIFLELKRNGGSVDLNSVIMILLMAGLLLHWRPSAYIAAVKNAARITGPLILHYTFYGGLTCRGLAEDLYPLFDHPYAGVLHLPHLSRYHTICSEWRGSLGSSGTG